MYLDMTIHDFDMARFMVGEVDEVYAMGSVLVAPWLAEAGDVDTDIVTLRFANGALGVIDNSRQAVYGYDQRLEVFCSAGVAQADNQTVDTVVRGDISGMHAGLPRASSCSVIPRPTSMRCASSSIVCCTTSRRA